MRYSTLSALLAYQAAAIAVQAHDEIDNQLVGAATCATQFGPMIEGWWDALNVDGAVAVGAALNEWLVHHDAVHLSLEAAGCAWIGAKGSYLPFVDEGAANPGPCKANVSEFLGFLMLASMGAQCTDDQLDQLVDECDLAEYEAPTELLQVAGNWFPSQQPQEP